MSMCIHTIRKRLRKKKESLRIQKPEVEHWIGRRHTYNSEYYADPTVAAAIENVMLEAVESILESKKYKKSWILKSWQ